MTRTRETKADRHIRTKADKHQITTWLKGLDDRHVRTLLANPKAIGVFASVYATIALRQEAARRGMRRRWGVVVDGNTE